MYKEQMLHSTLNRGNNSKLGTCDEVRGKLAHIHVIKIPTLNQNGMYWHVKMMP